MLSRRSAFTLLEMLLVVGILAILLIAIVPNVAPLAKSAGRKSAVANLLGVIEQARTQAVRDGQPTYVVFPNDLPGSPDAATVQRYSYRSYAIFEDDPSNPGSVKQLTQWRSLPTGISFRTGSLNFLAATTSFLFTPMGAGTTARFPFLRFDQNGEVDPASTPSTTTGIIQLGVFEGFVTQGGIERDTNSAKPTDSIAITRLTGRAERM